MTKQQAIALATFALTDPEGFHAALVNTIDTHAERVEDARYSPVNQDPNLEHHLPREQWALEFLLRHENGETSDFTQED